ncbi:MAG: DNA polymerase III subunit gamma/tau [Alistipes sp.]|nr:DNA polymerase III subunit gamma/tau [Alistipes sp.]MBR0393652.1 DNA polymerase III subunit gamma/tau [Alistipes sp.]
MEQFVVSARKYRPATFASVVGQKHITSTLKNAIERNQLAHAYLFCGPRGVGKTTCARIFAKAINCLHPVGAEACNECDSCRSFNEGRSLNIHELDAASNNSVEDIRNLIEQVRVIPQIGHYSVFIIDEVHMLSQAAFNAFLKTLEEPPQHAIFILATTEKHKIIPTILSRCQIYDFNRIRVEDAVDYLRYIANNEGVSADEESLNLIAQKADGGMRDALSMFDKAVSFCGTSLEYRSVAQTLNVLDYDTYFRFTEMLAKGDYVNALLEFDRVLSKGFSGQIFMNGLNQHFRDLLVAKGPAVSLIEYTGTLMERYRTQAAACEPNFLFGAISLLSEADGKLRTASNQRLLVELTLMKIAVIGQKKNSGLSLPVEENYPLPNLNEARQGAAQSGVVASAVPSAPNTASNVMPNVTPVAPAQPVPQVQAPQEVIPMQVSVAREVAPQPTTQPTTQPQAQPPQSQGMAQESGARPRPQGRPRVSPLGVSLTSMLKEASATDEEGAATLYRVDAESQSKLTAAKDAILAEIGVRRPRFVVAFEQMRIEGNKIVLDAPSEVLRNEIVAERTEISDMIIEVARINGVIELEINVQEQEVKLRPIKLEDRLHHMERVVPLFKELRESLDFDVE